MPDFEETIEERTDERLNHENLAAYLREHGFPGGIEVCQFPAGSSNLTYLVKVGNSEFVLRRPPFGNTVKTAHDMRREFDVLSKLSAIYPPAPKPLLFCDEDSVIGSEFYLMERRRGIIIRGKIRQIQVGELVASDENVRRSMARAFIQNLSELHSLNCGDAGLSDLGKPGGYCRRQVEGWTKRYFAAKTHEHAELEAAIETLNENIPIESAASLVHNDYKFDNVMLDPDDLTRITAVLDWEMVTVGDPLMDIGTTLGYWMDREAGDEMLDMPFNPRVLMENISRRELVEMYADASGRDVSNILYYYIFGTFKIAVIAQQIYARYARGFTKDKRFATFDRFVSALGRIAANAIDRGTI
jgi:aminoglycoside phosphotransferase (APT) family kinase protein